MLDANVCIGVMNGNPPGLRARVDLHPKVADADFGQLLEQRVGGLGFGV